MSAQPSGGGVSRVNPGGGGTLADVLDRVLDKGVVIDAWAAVSLLGMEIISVQAQVVVASVETYLKYAQAISGVSLPAAEKHEGKQMDAGVAGGAAARPPQQLPAAHQSPGEQVPSEEQATESVPRKTNGDGGDR